MSQKGVIMFDKIVFYDADGTVIRMNDLNDAVVEAMKQLRKNGILPVLCTGRSLPSVTHSALSRLDLSTAVTAAGGAVFIDNQLVSHDYMSKEHLKEIVDYFDSYHLYYTLECNDALYMYPDSAKHYMNHFEVPLKQAQTEEERRKTEIREKNFKDQLKLTDDPLNLHVNKIHWYEDPNVYQGQAPLTYPEVKAKLGDRFNVNPLSYMPQTSGGEINEKIITKVRGMKIVMDHFGIDKDHVYAIGDGENDMEMLAYAGHAIAMGNGNDHVKSVAEYVTDTIQNNGFVTAMKHYRLI